MCKCLIPEQTATFFSCVSYFKSSVTDYNICLDAAYQTNVNGIYYIFYDVTSQKSILYKRQLEYHDSIILTKFNSD